MKLRNKRNGIILVIIILSSLSVFSDINAELVVPNDPTSIEGKPELVTGAIQITVIPVYFPDCPPTLPLANISSMIFGNISDYFFEESYGAVWLTGSVLDWFSVENNRSFYVRGSLNSPDSEIRKNASEGCSLFREEVEDQFTMIESNFTEHILILYSGGSSIHPHHRVLTVDVDDVSRNCETSIAPELYSFGTITHEIAHGLGLHDLYNKDKLNCWSTFMGSYDLMSNAGSGHSISGMCAYSKISLGWIKPSEILDININSTVRLLRIEEWGEGPRVIRIPIDRWRYYLVEVQYYWQASGILISRVDRSRDTGGYGRVEIVRSALGVQRIEHSLFTEHQKFIDPYLGLTIEVIENDDPWHEVGISFAPVDTPLIVSLPIDVGEVQNVTSVVDLNGTSYFAVCAMNSTTQLRNIHLFRFTDTLEYISHTPFSNDTINPVLVSGYDGILLIFEVLQANKHTIVAQFNETTIIVSGDDDAHNPTAAFSGNGVYVAYENHTDLFPSIVVRKGSSHSWESGISFFEESSSMVRPTEDGFPHSPNLCPANNHAVLTYLWSGEDQNDLKFKWDIDSLNITLRFENVESFVVEPLSEYSLFISITLSNGTTTVYYWKSWEDQPELVNSHRGIGVGVVPILGLWEGYRIEERCVLTRVWDRWYSQGASMEFYIGSARFLTADFCSLYGSTALSTVCVDEGSITIRIWPILSLSDGYESTIGEVATSMVSKLLVASVLCIALFYHWDEKVRKRLNFNRFKSSQSYWKM